MSGRWHSRGLPILYAAEHPALALLEALAHFARGEIPAHYQLLGIEIPETNDNVQPELPENWAQKIAATQQIGDIWLGLKRSLLMKVPSVLVPHAWNFLINPAHPDIAAAAIASRDVAPFDARLH